MRTNQRTRLEGSKIGLLVTVTITAVILFVVDQIMPLPEEPPAGVVGPPGVTPLWSAEGILFIAVVIAVVVLVRIAVVILQ